MIQNMDNGSLSYTNLTLLSRSALDSEVEISLLDNNMNKQSTDLFSTVYDKR